MRGSRATSVRTLALGMTLQVLVLSGCGPSSSNTPNPDGKGAASTGGNDSKTPNPGKNGSASPSSAEDKRSEKPLDDSVSIISVARCWDYKPKALSIEGKFFESYAVLSYGCDSGEYVTFDTRGWSRFEGYAAILPSDSRPNTLLIKVDEETAAEHQLNYGSSALPLNIDLNGHRTLTFKKAGRYPEIVIAEPKLLRDN